MTPLHVETARLSSNDKVTVAKLYKLGFRSRGVKHTLDAAALGANGLSTNALVALARAAVPPLLDADGRELRAAGFVASEVTVRSSGEADFTLSMDLAG
jgi:hypothetical protein